ncbi:MAG: hypothetical protein HC800_10155 [Phormidesmis sp. RL_2_1]|nr:hypothetical protein [Phormidesmis sp. RL_2_1]
MMPSNISPDVDAPQKPQQPSTFNQSDLAENGSENSGPKERSQITLWSVATIFFLLGTAAASLSIWQLHKLYRATIAPVVTVEGTLQAKYDYQTDDELQPAPNGYFIESAGIGRVYLSGKPLQSYVGQPIQARGGVSGICGPKSIPCFPLVELREVSRADVTP